MYLEDSYADYIGTLTKYGGNAIYIRNSANLHYTIKEDTSFAIVIFVSTSQELYIDIFPSFTYYATSPKQLWTGAGCEGDYAAYKLGDAPGGDIYSRDSCNIQCKITPDC